MDNTTQHLLIVNEGPDQGQIYILEGALCTLGRASDNTIMVDSARISRHHAQIRLQPDRAVLEDLGSTNGTWLNGRRIDSPQPLSPGDVIGLADHLTLRYESEDTMQTERLAPSGEGIATQVLPETQSYPATPPTPTPPPAHYDQGYAGYDTPVPHTDDAYSASRHEPASYGDQQYAEAHDQGVYNVAAEEEPPTPSKRGKWLYIGLGVLIFMICACVALGVYLWFAPREFWEWLFELVGVSLVIL